jgi:hypothetical protein
MANLFTVQINDQRLRNINKNITPIVRDAIKTVTMSLANTASGATPHEEGILQGSYTVNFKGSNGKKIIGTVEFNVTAGGYNYAISMHEWNYTPRKSGRAGTGMSGASYPAGNKYLTRPLEGEKDAYRDYIAREIDRFLNS